MLLQQFEKAKRGDTTVASGQVGSGNGSSTTMKGMLTAENREQLASRYDLGDIPDGTLIKIQNGIVTVVSE